MLQIAPLQGPRQLLKVKPLLKYFPSMKNPRAQVDLSLLPRGFQERSDNPRVNAGGKKRRTGGSSAGATLVAEFAPPSTGRGRGRGAKRSLVYAGLAAYNAHFASLVVMELKHEKVGFDPHRLFGFAKRGGGEHSCKRMRKSLDRRPRIPTLPGRSNMSDSRRPRLPFTRMNQSLGCLCFVTAVVVDTCKGSIAMCVCTRWGGIVSVRLPPGVVPRQLASRRVKRRRRFTRQA